METRRLGRTEHIGPVVIFPGIAAGRLDTPDAVREVNRAIDRGIVHFDVAPSYGDSEVKLGEALKGRRDEVFLAAKTLGRTREDAAKELRSTLKNLHTDHLDLYQFHALDTDEDLERILSPGGAMETFLEARKAGTIRFIGITGHNPREQARALREFDFDTVMVPVNFVDHFVSNAEDGLLPLAEKKDVGVLAMKATYRGAIEDVETAYRYTLSQKVSRTVPAGSVEEFWRAIEVASAFEPMSIAEQTALFRDAPDLGDHHCRQCGYCMPCPAGVDIPRVFALEAYADRYREDIARGMYAQLPIRANACTECGHCEEKCPFELKIIERMKGMDAKFRRA